MKIVLLNNSDQHILDQTIKQLQEQGAITIGEGGRRLEITSEGNKYKAIEHTPGMKPLVSEVADIEGVKLYLTWFGLT